MACAVLLMLACHDTATGPGVDLRYASVAAGTNFTCALTRDGRAFCWGDDFNGQLGRVIDSTYASAPVAVSGGHRFTAIAAGASHTCGLSADGSVWCWGLNASGQLGGVATGCSNAITATDCSALPVRAAGTALFKAIGAGGNATCGVTDAGAVMCWGAVMYTVQGPTLVSDSTHSRYVAVAPVGYFGCGLTTTDDIRCWGYNYNGVLGRSDVTFSSALIATLDTVPRTALTAASSYACALDRDGLAACWGVGTLGNATVASSTVPVPVDSGKHFSVISGGDMHVCGVATDGSAWCWGSDSLGMLGHSSLAPVCGSPWIAGSCQKSPVRVGDAGAPYTAIAAGQMHTCAVTQAGTAWCWGRNSYGSLGTGTTTDSRTPVQALAADTTR